MRATFTFIFWRTKIVLEFEPGFTGAVQQRLEKYIIAEDVKVADVSSAYGLLSVQGPKAAEALERLPWNFSLPTQPNALAKNEDKTFGDIYVVNRARLKTTGFDIFVPSEAMNLLADPIIDAVRAVDGLPCGWQAMETARIERNGRPRFGVDMDESNLAPEALGIEAISYDKGCYIGQEVIAGVWRDPGQVAKSLHGLRLADQLATLPAKGAKLFLGDKEVGYVTSAVHSPRLNANIALGYVRREANQIGTELLLQINEGKVAAKIVESRCSNESLSLRRKRSLASSIKIR